MGGNSVDSDVAGDKGSQLGAPTLISQGEVGLGEGCTTTFVSSGGPAHPGTAKSRRMATPANGTRLLIGADLLELRKTGGTHSPSRLGPNPSVSYFLGG